MEQDFSLGTLAQLRPPSVTDMVYDELYARIVGLDMLPGTKLSEAEVAAKMGVSRQPVRDAFYRLSQQGFLLIRPQRATIVTKISPAAVHQARFIRTALELETLRAAMEKATPADIDRLSGNITAQDEAIAKGDREGFHTLDDAFHALICEIAGHPEVWTLIRDNKAHMDRVRFLSLDKGSQIARNEHGVILDAIRAGDTAHAIEKMRDHLGRIGRSINEIRAEHTDYFEED